ncbi:hypothetical protein ACTL6U_04710 [Rhodovibrionaceae bacterium A322]
MSFQNIHKPLRYQEIEERFREQGLRLRGGFNLSQEGLLTSAEPGREGVLGEGTLSEGALGEATTQNQLVQDFYDPSGLPDLAGRRPATLLLVGAVGGEFWSAFSQAPEFSDGRDNALDRWSERLIRAVAGEAGGLALFPSDGPPYQPFQLWARLSEPVFSSPLGLLVHPDWGLWHAYRGALLLPQTLEDLPQKPHSISSPCDSCREKPCLHHCPVGAFSTEGYDVAACARHLRSADLANCLQKSCAARRACPLGRDHHYDREQTAFFMSAFLESHPE